MKSTKNNAKKTPSNRDSFLEAFRELGSDLTSNVSDNLVKGGVQDIKEALFPFNLPQTENQPINPFQKEADLEQKYRAAFQRNEAIHREEKVLFTREQRETQEKVQVLQNEIKSLAQTVGKLASEAKEAEINALQKPAVVGKYHLNFFERLRHIIAELRVQIQESSLWLETWNKKAKKKNYYWGQFKKSGSKFLLSSDRYMATQAG